MRKRHRNFGYRGRRGRRSMRRIRNYRVSRGGIRL